MSLSLFCISDLSPSFVESPIGSHFKGFPLPASVSTGDWTSRLLYARQLLCHWATALSSPVLTSIFLSHRSAVCWGECKWLLWGKGARGTQRRQPARQPIWIPINLIASSQCWLHIVVTRKLWKLGKPSSPFKAVQYRSPLSRPTMSMLVDFMFSKVRLWSWVKSLHINCTLSPPSPFSLGRG